MKLFKVTYEGLWMGGIAFVFAENENDAKEKVENHSETRVFNDVTVSEINVFSGVIYNDNGDY